MNIKVKKLDSAAIIPSYSKPGDAGMDLTAVSKKYDQNGNLVYGTGLAFEIPTGFVGLLFPRSSNSKKDLHLTNSVGVLDSGYRGEVFFKFKPSAFFAGDVESPVETTYFEEVVLPQNPIDAYEGIAEYEIGERVGQIIILPYPEVTFDEVDELSTTERGEGGFGSTGK